MMKGGETGKKDEGKKMVDIEEGTRVTFIRCSEISKGVCIHASVAPVLPDPLSYLNLTSLLITVTQGWDLLHRYIIIMGIFSFCLSLSFCLHRG